MHLGGGGGWVGCVLCTGRAGVCTWRGWGVGIGRGVCTGQGVGDGDFGEKKYTFISHKFVI